MHLSPLSLIRRINVLSHTPMLHSVFEINQYVIFKYQEEWQEGRILDIVVSEDTRPYYKIKSFLTLSEVPTLLFDHILHNTPENIKKVKGGVSVERVPLSKEVRGILEYDREMVRANRMYRGPSLETVFSSFLCTTKCNLTREEIELGTEGLKYIFNCLVKKILMSPKERKFLESLKRKGEKKKEIGENKIVSSFGIVYGIRAVYHVLKEIEGEKGQCREKGLCYEFLIYFLDFCSLKVEKYYDKAFYE